MARSVGTVTEIGWRRLALLWLTGMDLRLPLLAIPPVLPIIHQQLQLDEKGVAALSSLPVLLLGLAAVPGSVLIARIGARRALIAGLCVTGVASGLRGLGPSAPVLFTMTVLMGIGIAMTQTTLPALVRQWYPGAITRATGVWSNGLLSGELVGAAATLPLMALLGWSWPEVFVVWAAIVLGTAVLVAVGTPHVAAEAGYWRGSGVPNWRDVRTWQLGLLQAASSMIYFGTNTFVPDYLHEIGQPGLVAAALASLNGAQVPASLVVGLVPWEVLSRRVVMYVASASIVVALAAILSGQPLLIVVAGGMIGFAGAYILVVCFALPALLAEPADVARLSAGGFTVSYCVSFTVNLAAGAAWDATHISASAFLPVLLGAVLAAVLGPKLASRPPTEIRAPLVTPRLQ
ncbi:MAG: transporter, family, cyanate transporter [Chloroflexota bacterium]|jgi:CP family cyanate transporter-like MFS transporter|nr:transporter, family, cyanate transporter [Chloroflexota bacterium]